MAARILIADDDPDIVSVLQDRLQSHGYDIITARDGQEAIGQIAQESPNLVLLDLTLPKLSGIEVLKHLNRSKQSDTLPVVVMTAHGSIDIAVEAMKEGAYDFINYMMEPEPNAQVAYTYGGLPTVNGAFSDPRYADSVYWQAVIEMFEAYTIPMDPIADYDKVMLKISDTVVKLAQNPNLDIMQELQKVQDELNSQ